jgi:predicted dinucleotide-binding enzyme
MKIATIGAGNIGGTLGTLWAKANHEVMFSSRHPEDLQGLTRSAGQDACSGSYEQAAAFGEVVLLAIPLYGIIETFPRIQPYLQGKVAIDAMNFFENRDGRLAAELEKFGGLSTSLVASRLPEAKIVKAFNCVRYRDLQTEAHRRGPRVAMPYAGEDREAKDQTAVLIGDAGFEPLDLGGLEDVRPVQPGGPLFTLTGTREELEQLLGKSDRV